MASNYTRSGNRLDYTATGADVAAGDIVFVGLIACLAENAIAEDETGSVLCEGCVAIPTASALAVGALVEMAAGLAVAQGAGGGKVVGTVVKVLTASLLLEVKLNAGIAAIATD